MKGRTAPPQITDIDQTGLGLDGPTRHRRKGLPVFRSLYVFATNLASSAFAMLLAHLLLGPSVRVRIFGFITSVVVFTVAQTIVAPIVTRVASKHATALLSGVGLISTFLALFIATLFPGGIRIWGQGWISATLLVWVVTAIGNWIAIDVYFERYIKNRKEK